jgi:hypothetical protein
LLLAGCNKPAGTSTPGNAPQQDLKEPKQTTEIPAQPFCSVDAPMEKDFQEGAVIQTWNLKVYGLKSLTARLLIITDGKVNTANESALMWNKWEPTAPPATGQLVLLIQDGVAFGAKGKRLPSLSLELVGSPTFSGHANSSKLFLAADLQVKLTSSWSVGFEIGKQLIYSQIFLEPGGQQLKETNLRSDLDTAINISRDGRTVLAVELEARPRD